jgi:hypothetical protein
MNDSQSTTPPFDPGLFNENRSKFPLDQLAKYAGQYVAWSGDGRSIVACAETDEQLYARLESLGIDWQQVVFSFVPELDVSYL